MFHTVLLNKHNPTFFSCYDRNTKKSLEYVLVVKKTCFAGIRVLKRKLFNAVTLHHSNYSPVSTHTVLEAGLLSAGIVALQLKMGVLGCCAMKP